MMQFKKTNIGILVFALTANPLANIHALDFSSSARLDVVAAGGTGGANGVGPGPYNIANISSGAQRRWTRLSVPTPIASTLPDQCRFSMSGGAPTMAIKGRRMGSMVTTFHVLGDVAGSGYGGGTLDPVGGMPSQPFQMSEWITDDPSRMVMTLHAVRDGVRTSIPFQLVETVENSPVVRTERFLARPVRGVWGELFLTYYTQQDVVDLEGRFGWSDPDDPLWTTNFESVELTMGEDFELYFGSRSGFRRIPGGTLPTLRNAWQLFSNAQRDNGVFPDGMAPHFYGVILPRSDSPSTANPPDREVRLARMEAARQGPLVMTGNQSVWDGHWFAFGETPRIPPGINGVTEANRRAASFRTYLTGTGGFWDERPLANRWNTGTTGGQAPFGATKGTLACTVGDPRFVWEMLYSSTDYGLRTFHRRERDGSRVTAANHPQLFCSNGVPHLTLSRDLLGKSTTRAFSWDMGRTGPDGQHRGQNYMWAAAALSGSWILQEVARDLLECDLTGRGPGNDPTAPRSLRTQQDMAKIYGILPTAQEQQNIINVMDWALTTWERGWDGGTVTGPVKPMFVSGADPRVLCCSLRFFVPWNEALGVMGLMESRALMRKIGRTDLQTRYENLMRPIMTTHLLYSTMRDAVGVILPINGVAWLPDGQPQPASYYDINRPGVSTRQSTTTDLLLGTPGWFSWWAGMVKGASIFLPHGSVARGIAEEILNTQLLPTDIDKAEWMAVGEP